MSFEISIMLIVFLFLLLSGFPVSFGMILSSILYFIITGMDLYSVVQRMFVGINDFILLAVPFFVLLGELMSYSGTSKKLLDFVNLFVGRFVGGLGYVNVLASMLFGGCSGSALADVGGLGRVEIEMMTESNYPKAFSTAITVSSSIQGAIIPPSIDMVVMGSVLEVSIGALLIGGLIPGILIGLGQCLVVGIIARRRKFPTTNINISFKEKIKITMGSLPFLILPVMIIGGILGGVATPTEVAAFASLYGLILVFIFKRKDLKIKELFELFVRTGIVSGSILMLMGGASIFSWIISVENIPEQLSNIIFSLTSNPYLILLLLNIFFLFWGMFMSSLAAIVIFIPMLAPIIETVGINPIHFGVVIVVNLVIGLITPPYGAGLITGQVISGVPMGEIIKEMLPMIFISIIVLFIITYIPSLVLWLPSMFGLTV